MGQDRLHRLFLVGCLLEMGLAWLGVGIEYVVTGERPRWVLLEWSSATSPGVWLWTAAALLPPVGFAIFAASKLGSKINFLKTIHDRIHTTAGRQLLELSPWQVIVLSLCAGVGEEVLFRGALQPHLGLLLSSGVFALFHSLSIGYIAIAFGMSLYLGGIYEAFERQLLIPILIHAIYDAIAIFLLRRRFSIC